jgi:putative PIN family toxin of toxin-antitoxin system
MIRDCSFTTSTSILDELDDVLARPKFGISPSDRSVIRHVLIKAADEVVLLDESEAGRYVRTDPGDDHIVEAAIRTGADLLVSEDADLLNLSSMPFSVVNASNACRTLRESGLPGETFLFHSERSASENRPALAAPAGWEHRESAARLQELTAHLEFARIMEGVEAALLEPSETTLLVKDLLEACAGNVPVHARDGTSFDHLSGLRVDISPLVPVALDLIWYSHTWDRAAPDTIRRPLGPTAVDLEWVDDTRCRSVLAGGLVLALRPPGPDETSDLRCLALVDEPLASVPDIHTEYRRTLRDDDGGALTVMAVGPGPSSSCVVPWLAGGPSSLLSPILARTSLTFLLADHAARHFGLPVPPKEIVERRVSSALRGLVIGPGS